MADPDVFREAPLGVLASTVGRAAAFVVASVVERVVAVIVLRANKRRWSQHTGAKRLQH